MSPLSDSKKSVEKPVKPKNEIANALIKMAEKLPNPYRDEYLERLWGRR